jgi:hypothetical protein
MGRPTEQRFRAAAHDLHRAGLNVEYKAWGFNLYHQDAGGTYRAEAREEMDDSISLWVVVDAAPRRWFFRRTVPEIVDLLVSSFARTQAQSATTLAAALDAAEGAFDRENLRRQLYDGKGPFAALVVSLPEQHFSDDDDICAGATTDLAVHLEAHLVEKGHSIPDWIQGGCAEDWGTYLRSRKGEVRYDYQIMFFPRGSDARSIAIMYGVRVGFWRRLFGRQPRLEASDPLHQVLWEFGAKYERPQLVTQAQIDAEHERSSQQR